MKYLILLCFICFGFSAYAESIKKYSLGGSYSYLDTWLPSKLGVSAAYLFDDHSYELAVEHASYNFDLVIHDLGSISENRFLLQRRNIPWSGSFNYQFGLSYHTLSIDLGNTYTDLAGASISVLSIKTIDALVGIGNFWTYKETYQFGVNWIRMHYPIISLSGEDDYKDIPASSEQDDLKDLTDILTKLPTFSLLQLEFKYKF